MLTMGCTLISLMSDWTFAYTASNAVPDPLLGAAVAQQGNFCFLVTFVPVQVVYDFDNRNPYGRTYSGYIYVPRV